MTLRILHLLPQASSGGATQSALRAAQVTAALGEHSLMALVPSPRGYRAPAAPPIVIAPGTPTLHAAIAAADLVHLHFWNTPALYALLRAPWPPARVLVWAHIAGHAAPQVLPPALLAWPDMLAAASPFTLDLPAVRAAPPLPAGRRLIFPVPDFSRLAGVAPAPHTGFTVGYVGTVSFDKLHPDYVALHAGVSVPPARFVLAGTGGAWPRLQRQAQALGLAEQFEYRGYVRDLGALFSALDVFGYPLAPDNYAAAELVLQEALFAGVPPVVLRPGAAARLIVPGETGLVVDDAPGYQRAIESLFHHPAERARLSANARAYARERFRADDFAASLVEAYAALLALPKRPRAWPTSPPSPFPAAAGFVEALGATPEAVPFALSLAGAAADEALLAADTAIARSTPLMSSAAAGGVLHYRRADPTDAMLCLWAGLVLAGQGRAALAVAEFTQARHLGLVPWRADWHLARAAQACGALEVADAALARLRAAAPHLIA
ncbi:MAG: glycosyltransferase family 4 protein [Anaerolineales bacterium]|nr:glycosyltransferase family 4 protein [Anaerolineales bacterium]